MKTLITLMLAATMLVACKKDEETVPFNIVGEWDVSGSFTIWLKPTWDEWESPSAFGRNNTRGHYEYRNDSLIIKVAANGFGQPTYIFDSITRSNDNKWFNCRIAYWNGDPYNVGIPCKFTRIR